jgi:hypothetical protein
VIVSRGWVQLFGTTACSTWPRQQASWPITKRKATGSTSAPRDQFPFLVGGSDEDPFERRQVDLAQERLSKLGLEIVRLPGGHLTTHKQPEALAIQPAAYHM